MEFSQRLGLLVSEISSNLKDSVFFRKENVFFRKGSHRRAPGSIGEREFNSNNPWIPCAGVLSLWNPQHRVGKMGKYVEKWNFLWKLADFWVWKHCIEVSWTIYRLKWCRSWVKHLMEIPKLAIFDSFVHKLSWNSSGILSMSWAVVPVPAGLVWNLAALFPPIRWKDGKCRISAWAALHWLSKCVPHYCYLMFAHSRARRNWMRIQIKETELTHIFPGIG